MIKDAENYAFTVTFSHLNSNYPARQFWETAPDLTKVLSESTNYEMYPEWRTTNGTIHYHGTLSIYDKIKWYKKTLPTLKRYGYNLIKKIDNMEKWTTYIRKDVCTAQGILGEEVFLPICSKIPKIKVKKQCQRQATSGRESITDIFDNLEKLKEELTQTNKI